MLQYDPRSYLNFGRSGHACGTCAFEFVDMPRSRVSFKNSAIAAPQLVWLLLVAIYPTTTPKGRGWRERVVKGFTGIKARKEQVKQE